MKNLQGKKLNTRLYNILLIFLMGGFIFSALFMPSVAEAGLPIIYTQSASLVSKDSFQLNGWVDSTKSDAPVKYWFEWGQTKSFGNFTYPTTIYTAFPQNISARITIPDSTALYYFRVAAQNSQGTNFGNIFSFRIPRESIVVTPPPPPIPAPTPTPIQPVAPPIIEKEIPNAFINNTKNINDAKDTKETVKPELMTAALVEQVDMPPTFLNLTLILIIIILTILWLYYYNLYTKQNKKVIFLEDKIDNLEKELDKNNQDNAPKNMNDIDENENEPEEEEEEKARQKIENMAKENIEFKKDENDEINKEENGGEIEDEEKIEKEYLV